MATVDTVISQLNGTSTASSTTKSKNTLDKDDFLKLLVTQLTHQDPSNPMDDTQMTAQLAQFSQLEQLTNINTSIGQLVTNSSKTQQLSAVSYIGKSVAADGYTITKQDGGVSSLFFSLDTTVSTLQVNVYDAEGNIVRSESLGATKAGNYTYQWDGNDASGQAAANGTYSVAILAETADGQSVLAKTTVSGLVTGVYTDSSTGTQYLVLQDGRYVNLANVTQVVAGSSSSTTTSS